MRGLDLFSFEDEDQTHYVVKFELKYLKNAGLKVGLNYCRKIKKLYKSKKMWNAIKYFGMYESRHVEIPLNLIF